MKTNLIAHALVAIAIATIAHGAAVAAAAQPPAAAQPAAGIDARYERAITVFAAGLTTDVAADKAGSITAGVVVGDRVIWKQGFGAADVSRGISANGETIYRIGSISKSMTAVLMAILVQQGTLSLDDSVAKHLPAVQQLAGRPAGSRAITYRQLGSHTAGLIREPQLAGAATGPFERWEARVLESIPTTSFQSAPGTRHLYSNIGYGIMGLALSRAAGRPFRELMTDRLFTPVGMSSSGFVLTPAMRLRLATGYERRGAALDTAVPAREHAGRGYKVPNGGVYSTVDDLARFISLMSGAAGSQVLTAAMRAELLRVQTPEDPLRGYGLGFSVASDSAGNREAGHGGSVAGYTAHIVFDPDRQIGVILLRNYAGGAVDLARRATELLRELRRVPR